MYSRCLASRKHRKNISEPPFFEDYSPIVLDCENCRENSTNISHISSQYLCHLSCPYSLSTHLYPISKPQPCWAPHLSLKSQLSNARPKPHPSVDIRLGCFPLPFPSVKRLADLRFSLGIPYNPPSLKNQCILVATRGGACQVISG